MKENRVTLWLDDLRNPFIDLEGKVPKDNEPDDMNSNHWQVDHNQLAYRLMSSSDMSIHSLHGITYPKPNKLVWVLNYEQFVQWIEKFGLPDIISFDHDLADQHYTPEEYWDDYDKSKEYQDAQNYTEKTGLDCAKWLVDYCIDNKKKMPTFYVHSANPVGADNIRGLLNNYIDKCE